MVARIGVTVAVALVQMVIFVGLAIAAFGLQLTGSWWMAVPILFCGTLAFMAIGLLAGAVCKTAEAASGFANFIVLPMAFLSGSFIPLDAAPGWIRIVSLALPLRYLNEGMLDTMVRGLGPASALLPMAILLAFALVIGFIATRNFQWERAESPLVGGGPDPAGGPPVGRRRARPDRTVAAVGVEIPAGAAS